MLATGEMLEMLDLASEKMLKTGEMFKVLRMLKLVRKVPMLKLGSPTQHMSQSKTEHL